MLERFSAERVALEVLEELERSREALVGSQEAVEAEVERALDRVREAYVEAMLPAAYMEALAREIRQTLPAAWRAIALPFTQREGAEFGLWRGGDPIARLTYVAAGLVLGGLAVEAPFIPIWEKWFPFALAAGAWWLPDVQLWWQKRRYERELGGIAARASRAQPALDEALTPQDLLESVEYAEPKSPHRRSL